MTLGSYYKQFSSRYNSRVDWIVPLFAKVNNTPRFELIRHLQAPKFICKNYFLMVYSRKKNSVFLSFHVVDTKKVPKGWTWIMHLCYWVTTTTRQYLISQTSIASLLNRFCKRSLDRLTRDDLKWQTPWQRQCLVYFILRATYFITYLGRSLT